MFPTLKSGQTFVGLKTKKIGVGDVVIVKAHGSVDMVKRVTSIEGEKITVSGDNKNLKLRPRKKNETNIKDLKCVFLPIQHCL